MPVHYFDLELKTKTGVSLSRQKMNTEYGGKPLFVKEGLELDMVWDIAINHIDPKLIKAMMPSVTGFTSRLQDNATRDFTLFGNMKLDRSLKKKAHELHEAEKRVPEIAKKIKRDARNKLL